MPFENYANNASTTVATSSTGTTTGSKVVASTATFPATGQFRVVIESELAIASVVDATHLNLLARGSEGTTAADHAVGVTIEHVLTRESFLLQRALVNDVSFTDDFITGNGTTGSIGALGWTVSASPTAISAVAGHPGIWRLDTGTTISTSRTLSGRSDLNNIVDTDLWDVTFILRPVQADGSCILRAGMVNTIPTSGSDDGAYFLKGAADTTWQMFSVHGGVGTTQLAYSGVTSAIAANTWYRLRVRVIDATHLGFTVNDDTEVSWAPAQMPSQGAGLVQFVQITNNTGVTEQVDVDYASIRISGLSR